jgi:hypothetical protein
LIGRRARVHSTVQYMNLAYSWRRDMWFIFRSTGDMWMLLNCTTPNMHAKIDYFSLPKNV